MDNNLICEFCLETFQSQILLNKHIKTSKTCLKYKNNVFVCQKCNFSTKGIKNIDSHNETCEEEDIVILDDSDRNDSLDDDRKKFDSDRTTLDSERSKLDSDRKKLDDDRAKLDSERKKLDDDRAKLDSEIENKKNFNEEGDKFSEDVKNTKLLLTIEKTRSNMLSHFIEQNLNLKSELELDSDVDTIEKMVGVINSYFNTIKKPHQELVPNDVRKSTNYKTMTKFIELPMPVVEHIEEEEDLVEEQKYINLCDALVIFGEYFDKLKRGRVYTNELRVIKETRCKLFGSITLKDYIKLLHEHVDILTRIFQDKNYNEKKIGTTIFSSLNAVDARLLLYGNYTSLSLQNDEVRKFLRCIKISNESPRQLIPFNFTIFINSIINYSVAVIGLKDLIEKTMINRYGFFNIIYLPIKQSSDEDPYSFYVLDKINKEKRYWNMDCRLEALRVNISDALCPYLVDTFRKIYYEIFHDNEYRVNYNIKVSNIIESDCEQLLMSILLLTHHKKFGDLLRTIIKNKATYMEVSDKDKFNLHADDIIMKKRMSVYKDFSDDMVDVLKSMFDKITSEQAITLYKSKNL